MGKGVRTGVRELPVVVKTQGPCATRVSAVRAHGPGRTPGEEVSAPHLWQLTDTESRHGGGGGAVSRGERSGRGEPRKAGGAREPPGRGEGAPPVG